ncbi:hypothetical protein N0V93_004542 [Gnomoniopsis smithogilvyi]|uniref:SnoaL-like domain-containing protein n=1 Tax=Gnomoniopsis smithogilvyi TaxID=1191159 RepID=A0A9W8YSL5_9PEZI|nr:hypothetical protein N0V93_004542 [Gnomoniopsis smithogilvyi]
MSKRRETAIEVMDAFKAWDIDRIIAYRAENCTQQVVPKSLDRPAMDNAAFRQYFGGIMPLFKNFTPTTHQLIEDEKANTVVIWCSSTADTVIGPYGNEYVLLLHFNETGDKVEKIVEYVDTEYSKSFFGRLRTYLEEQKVQAPLPKYERGL